MDVAAQRLAQQSLESALQKLRQSEAYLAEAQRLSRTGSFGWNVVTGELVWSDETFCILGYDRSTVRHQQATLEIQAGFVASCTIKGLFHESHVFRVNYTSLFHLADSAFVRRSLQRLPERGSAFAYPSNRPAGCR